VADAAAVAVDVPWQLWRWLLLLMLSVMLV